MQQKQIGERVREESVRKKVRKRKEELC